MKKPFSDKPFTAIRLMVFFLFGLPWPVPADTLYLRAGEQAEGVLKAMEPETVAFEEPGGVKIHNKEDVARIQMQQSRRFDDITDAAMISDPDLRQCIAEQPSESDYPADGSATLLHRRVFDLTTPGLVRETTRTITKILRQRGENAASTTIRYFEDADKPEIDFALTVTPDGRVLHLNDTAIKDESVYARFPDYRRLSRLRFVCKEPAPGSILDVQYTVERTRNTPLEPFYSEEPFRYDSPLLRKEVVVITPSGTEIAHGLSAACAGKIDYSEISENGHVRRVWRLKQPESGIMQEPLMPPRNTFIPLLTLGAPASWDGVAQAYRAMLGALPPLSDPLRGKAVELAKHGGAAAIYEHIAKTIRTAPVGQHEFRFQPHSPDETASRGLANELDKNVLYWAMLKAAGFDCAFALVRNRMQGPLDENVPSIRAFHRSAVFLVKNHQFSTTVSDRLPFEAVPGDLQDAPALVFFDKGARRMKIPVAKPSSERDETRFEARLHEDGELDLTIVYLATGNGQPALRAFKDFDEQQLRHRLEAAAARIHPAALLKSYKTSDLSDLSVPPSISLSCRIPGFATTAGGDLMLFNLPAVDYSASDAGRSSREYGLFWFQTSRARVAGSIELPKGFAVYGGPGRIRLKTETVAYSARFSAKANRITFEDTYDIKTLCAPASAYADYKRVQEARAGLARRRVIIEKRP